MGNNRQNKFGDFRDCFESEQDFAAFRDFYDEAHELPDEMWLEAPFESFLQAAFRVYQRDFVMLPPQLSGVESIPICVFRMRMGEELARTILN
jgi:hypothetical protein